MTQRNHWKIRPQAAEDLKSNLLGIDKLNIINEDTDSDLDSGLNSTDSADVGTIDLSDAIADAVDDYESVWEKALKNSENLAQKYANKILKALKSGDWKGLGSYL